MAKRSRSGTSVPQQTPPIMHMGSPSLTPYADDWAANTTTESTAPTSAANLNAVFGNDMSPIPHGLPDVSDCAHSKRYWHIEICLFINDCYCTFRKVTVFACTEGIIFES